MFWRSRVKEEPHPRLPRAYYCVRDDCPSAMVGTSARDLTYGCLLCTPPDRLADMKNEEVRKRIAGDDELSWLWVSPAYCEKHGNPVVPHCPECRHPIGRYGDTPPIGMWGIASAGKTVYCAALMLAMESELFKWTGLLTDRLFDRSRYEEDVVSPLRLSGIVPAKTMPGEHRSVVLRLHGGEWPSRRVLLTDMAGAVFQFGSGEASDHAVPRAHMLRVSDALFLANPETSAGLGACARRDVFPYVQAIIEDLNAQGALTPFDEIEMRKILERIENLLESYEYADPSSLGPGRPSKLAQALAELVGDGPGLGVRLDGVMNRVTRTLRAQTPPLEQQLDELTNFLGNYAAPQRNGRFDIRLAVTVAKSDLLPDDLLPNHAEFLRVLSSHTPLATWRKTLERASEASRSVLVRNGEEQFVRKVEDSFQSAGYFFVSSLGRDTVTFPMRDLSKVPQRQAAVSMFGNVEASPGGPEPVTGWRVGKQLRVGPGGNRYPEPRNVLLPLLWLLTAPDGR